MWERWKTAGTIQQMLCAQFACVKTKKQIGIGSCKSPSHILDNDDNGANNFDTVDYAGNVDNVDITATMFVMTPNTFGPL